jgi:hypothetical protein
MGEYQPMIYEEKKYEKEKKCKKGGGNILRLHCHNLPYKVGV